MAEKESLIDQYLSGKIKLPCTIEIICRADDVGSSLWSVYFDEEILGEVVFPQSTNLPTYSVFKYRLMNLTAEQVEAIIQILKVD